MTILRAQPRAAGSGTDLAPFADLVPRDHGLAVLALARPDGTVHVSVVSAGVVAHPVSGLPAVGVVAAGRSRKLDHLRARPAATVVLRAGFRWVAAEGPAELAGPDDPLPGVSADRLRLLLREIFTAAGGQHDDLGAYDRAMAAERRTAVLITPDNLVAHCSELPRDRDVVLFCTCPSEATSAKMALAIRKLGVYRVRPLLGGFDEWKRLGYPLVEIEPAAAMA